jgi:hypothetical protein
LFATRHMVGLPATRLLVGLPSTRHMSGLPATRRLIVGLPATQRLMVGLPATRRLIGWQLAAHETGDANAAPACGSTIATHLHTAALMHAKVSLYCR